MAAAAAYVVVPESRDLSVPSLDLPGLGLSVLALGSLTWTIIEAPEHGWSSLTTLAGFAVAGSALVAFVLVERAATHPMLDVSLFRDRRFSAASGAVTVTFFALFGFIFLITQYFQFVRDYGPLSTGARILPVAVSIAVASVVGALLAPRIGTKVVVTTGLLLFGSAFLWISTVQVDTPYATVIVPQMVMMGLGMGLISTPATESILLVLPPARPAWAPRSTTPPASSGAPSASRSSGRSSPACTPPTSPTGSWHVCRTRPSRRPRSRSAPGRPSPPPPSSALRSSRRSWRGCEVSCVVVGIVCLVGAVAAAIALPGRIRTEVDGEEQVLVDA